MVFSPCLTKISYLKDGQSKRELTGAKAAIDWWNVYDSKEFLRNI